jgi:HEAT repeat protein
MGDNGAGEEPVEPRGGDRPGADYLTRIVAHLRALGSGPPSPAAWAEVEGYLHSKWQGLQAVAAQVLAGWGDHAAVAPLRALLLRSYQQEHWWTIRHVAALALRACVDERDAGWLLDHYFGLRGVLAKHELLWLVAALPVAAARCRLLAEARSRDRDKRQAAMKAIVSMPFPDKHEILERMADDPDPEIRSTVRTWLDYLAAERLRAERKRSGP